MTKSLILLALAWVAYYGLHSALLIPAVKSSIQKVGISNKNYRLIYTAVSVLGLLAVVWYYASLEKPSLNPEESMPVRILSMVLMGSGFYLLLKTMQSMTLAEFIGLRSETRPELKTDGLYELVRHPMYFSIIIMLFGGLMYAPSYAYLLSACITLVYIYVGASLEEKRLLKQFGKQYEKYRDKTPMLIPFIS